MKVSKYSQQYFRFLSNRIVSEMWVILEAVFAFEIGIGKMYGMTTFENKNRWCSLFIRSYQMQVENVVVGN